MLVQSGVFLHFLRNATLADRPPDVPDSFYLIYSQAQFNANLDREPHDFEDGDSPTLMAADFAYEPFLIAGRQGIVVLPVTNLSVQTPTVDLRTDEFWGPFTADQCAHFDPLPIDLVHDARIRNHTDAARFVSRWHSLLHPAA